MTCRLTYALSFLATFGLGCNLSNIIGADECTPGEEGCGMDDKIPPAGPIGPDRTDKVGAGTMSPFDPKEDGSSGVKLDANGNVVLDPGNVMGSTLPIIWVANSVEGTVSKVDTRTMTELARYYTYPGGGADPSRSTVSLTGDVVIANRSGSANKASAVKIAGDRAHCVDRNGTPGIQTNEGSGAVPAQFQWPGGGMAFAVGASLPPSADDCVLWATKLDDGSLPRAAGFDASVSEFGGYVYIGLHNTSELLRLDSRTGVIKTRINLRKDGLSPSPYGLVLDRDGRIWIWASNGMLVRVDPSKNDEVKIYVDDRLKSSRCGYGIAADAKGFIYTSGRSCLLRFDPVNESYQTLDLAAQGASSLRGLAVDQKYGVWITDTNFGMFHVDASGAQMVYKGKVQVPGSNVGAAIDFDGFPWVISQGQSRAYKIDPATYTTMKRPSDGATGTPVGQNPYTYSDMTGFQLRNAGAPNGVYRRTFMGCGATTRWFDLNWEISAPPLTEVVVSVRFGGTPMELMNAPWRQVAQVPPGKAPVSLIKFLMGARPDYMQVEFRMKSQDTKVTPILSSITASYNCHIIG